MFILYCKELDNRYTIFFLNIYLSSTFFSVYIDGVEFGGVKFFQLSSTWQTHVKSLTVALAGVPLATTEMN